MSQLARLKCQASGQERSWAAQAAEKLLARGFDQDDLEEMVKGVAVELGEASGAGRAGKNADVNAELAAADEINALSLEGQLVVLAAHHKTCQAFHAALESELKISLSADSPPLRWPPTCGTAAITPRQ